MMYIVRARDVRRAIDRNLKADDAKTYNWHVGEAKPRDADPFDDVVEVYADGHELENVRQNYFNIPDVPNAHSVRWKGDLAQFIYDHLPMFR